jgi:hypothetical protein
LVQKQKIATVKSSFEQSDFGEIDSEFISLNQKVNQLSE